MKRILGFSIPIAILFKGFFLLNILLLPLTALLTLFLGIMAGGSPGAGHPAVSFMLAIGMIYLAPLAVLLGHVVIAKGFDTVSFLVPPLSPRVSAIGLALGGILFVVAGNIFVDDLYQFRQGDFTFSFIALGMDWTGLAAVVGVGHIPLPFWTRRRDLDYP